MTWTETPALDKIEFPVSRFAPRQARRWISEAGGELSGERLEVLLLLVSEVVSNSVKHSGAGPNEHVEVQLTRQGTVLRVDVRDPGPGFVRPRTMGPGPHGLQILDAESDRWGVERSPATVWFELSVQDRHTAWRMQ